MALMSLVLSIEISFESSLLDSDLDKDGFGLGLGDRGSGMVFKNSSLCIAPVGVAVAAVAMVGTWEVDLDFVREIGGASLLVFGVDGAVTPPTRNE